MSARRAGAARCDVRRRLRRRLGGRGLHRGVRLPRPSALRGVAQKSCSYERLMRAHSKVARFVASVTRSGYSRLRRPQCAALGPRHLRRARAMSRGLPRRSECRVWRTGARRRGQRRPPLGARASSGSGLVRCGQWVCEQRSSRPRCAGRAGLLRRARAMRRSRRRRAASRLASRTGVMRPRVRRRLPSATRVTVDRSSTAQPRHSWRFRLRVLLLRSRRIRACWRRRRQRAVARRGASRRWTQSPRGRLSMAPRRTAAKSCAARAAWLVTAPRCVARELTRPGSCSTDVRARCAVDP